MTIGWLSRTGLLAPVSVVVPCFRCADTIRRAVASVAAQTLRPSELILVDDASGDDTLQVLQALAANYPFGWIKVVALGRNGGPSVARNRGWDEAGQKLVAFLDADDSWHPQKIETQLNIFTANPDIAILAHVMDVRPGDSEPAGLSKKAHLREIASWMFLIRNPIPTASVLLRRDLPHRFDPARRRSEDYLLWAQIAFLGGRVAKLSQVLASWHKPPFGAGGLTADLRAMNLAGIDARNQLNAQGLISRPALYVAHAIGYARYLRRCLIARRKWTSLDTVSGPGER